MEQPGLFDRPYPFSPGAKVEGTSRAAAEAMKPRAPTLRDRVLAELRLGNWTADDCAARLNVTVLACRPRLSELHRMGLIEDTGLTRENISGVRATVWAAKS